LSGDQRSRVARYRDTAKAIRDAARQASDPEIGEELLVIADRFDRLAEEVERGLTTRR
jgi:hypothetical protein